MKNTRPTRKNSGIPKHKEENVTSTSKIAVTEPHALRSRGRKRRNPIPTPDVTESPKLRKKIVEGREVDRYCWICHKIGQDEICKSCPRVYHINCIPTGSKFNAMGSCPECQVQSVNKQRESPIISRASLKELLKFVLQEALREDRKKPASKIKSQSMDNNKFCKYFKTWPQGSSDILCQIIDLEFLIDKMNDDINYYMTTAEFFSDVKWIYHNCCILHGPDSEITDAALKLEKNFKSELLDIEACAECYSIMHSDDYLHADFFTVLCKEPHDIVWAKLRGSPYWPAKCLKIYNGHADVRFFGTHDKCTIPISQCFRISQRNPNEKDIKQTKYQDAIRELSIYVSNYQRIHGNFLYFPPRTPLQDSKSKNVKKLQRRGRQRKNCQDKDDLIGSSPVHAKFESVAAEEVSVDSSDILVNENDQSDCSSTPARGSAASEPVSVCMDFTTDDDAIPFSSNNKMMKGAIHLPPPSQESLIGSTPPLHEDPIEIQSNSAHFVCSKGPDLLPVITCAVSGVMSAKDPLCFTGKNPATELSTMQRNIPNMFVNRINISNSENPSSNILSSGIRQFDDADEIQVIQEDRRDSPAINAIMKNPSLAHALSQLAVSNRPHLQKFYAECLKFGMRSYLQLGLPASIKWEEESAVVHFSQLYEQVEKAREVLKKENESLTQENSALKQENDFLRQDNENLKEKVKEYQGLNQILETRHKNSRTVISILLSKLPPGQSKPDSESLNLTHQCDNPFVEGSPLLVAKLKEIEKMLDDKDSKLKKLDGKTCVLENQILSGCVSEQIGQSVESQTDLSDMPDNQMFTVKDLDMSYEENSSESQEEILVQSNTVIMYADEGTTSSVHPLFDSGSLLMPDCSLVQPISVVSTSSSLLLSDVMPTPVVLSPALPCLPPKSVTRTSVKGKKRNLQRK